MLGIILFKKGHPFNTHDQNNLKNYFFNQFFYFELEKTHVF
jgi:hypothetical protein